MKGWRTQFPEVGAGGPVARSEAIMSQFVPGMDKIITPLKAMEALDFSFDADTG
jgi:hypothetical protein